MKRVLAALLCCLCGATASAQTTDMQGPKTMKTLVVYYSLTGNTDLVAQTLAGELGADVRRVEDVEKPEANWWFIMTGAFAAIRGAETPIKPIDARLQGYDRVFVGSPVWGGNPAPPINTFITQTDFTGKQVILFMTMGGNDAAGALQKLRERVEKKGGKVVDSFAISSGKATKEELAARAREVAGRFR